MMLYKIHPYYLDQKGLCGLWRDALVAQKILIELQQGGSTHSYRNHPQMKIWKGLPKEQQLSAIGNYLFTVWAVGTQRGYKFNKKLIYTRMGPPTSIPISQACIRRECKLLKKKLMARAPQAWKSEWDGILLEAHPLFEVEGTK